MEKRKFDEMVSFFNQKVAEMKIPKKYKMELLGMITAIEMEHDNTMPKWIPVSERLPEVFEKAICTDGESMMIGTYTRYGWVFPCYFREPIAWMPLSEPWRGEE